MKLIVAVDNNWAIGSGNDLLFNIPEDMKRFKAFTTGNIVVMGYNTLLSFPGSRPLPNRKNIVLCDDPSVNVEGAVMCGSLDALLEELKNYDSDKIFVIGGAMVYKLLLDYCSEAYITKIQSAGENPDKFFPNLDESPDWEIFETSEIREHNGIKFCYVTYTKK